MQKYDRKIEDKFEIISSKLRLNGSKLGVQESES